MHITFALVVVLDQLSKYFVQEKLFTGDSIEVIPNFLNLILTYNPGAAFGLMAGLPDAVRYLALGTATVVALVAVMYFFMRDYRHDRFAQIALAMILGGAVGNIIDRIRFGMVVDFIDVFVGVHHWPAFNVADSAICMGVAIIVLRKPLGSVR